MRRGLLRRLEVCRRSQLSESSVWNFKNEIYLLLQYKVVSFMFANPWINNTGNNEVNPRKCIIPSVNYKVKIISWKYCSLSTSSVRSFMSLDLVLSTLDLVLSTFDKKANSSLFGNHDGCYLKTNWSSLFFISVYFSNVTASPNIAEFALDCLKVHLVFIMSKEPTYC